MVSKGLGHQRLDGRLASQPKMLLSQPAECDFPETEVSQGRVAPAVKQEAHPQITILQCGFP